jgi:pimeloyl-ACP methyl ester carboxylesterase
MSFLAVNGRRLEVAWHGPRPDAAPTLVFLHEGLGSVSMWRDFPKRVAEATGCGALAYSRAGYGKSDPIELPRPRSYLHDEAFHSLGALLDAAQVREAILVGHSDGASVAIIYAGGVRDPRVRGLVLMAPHVHARDVDFASIASATETLSDPEKRRRLERHHGSNAEIAFRGWQETWLRPEFRDWSIEEYLPSIDVPMLLIQGEDDEYATLDQLDTIARARPVERLVLPGVGHRPFKDDPEQVIASIASFVGHIRNREA